MREPLTLAPLVLEPLTFEPLTFEPFTFVPLTFEPFTFVPLTFVPLTFVPLTFVPLTLLTFEPFTFVPLTFEPFTFVPLTLIKNHFNPPHLPIINSATIVARRYRGCEVDHTSSGVFYVGAASGPPYPCTASHTGRCRHKASGPASNSPRRQRARRDPYSGVAAMQLVLGGVHRLGRAEPLGDLGFQLRGASLCSRAATSAPSSRT
jgi:hypothetical protein